MRSGYPSLGCCTEQAELNIMQPDIHAVQKTKESDHYQPSARRFKAFYERQIDFLAAKDAVGLILNQYTDDAELVSFSPITSRARLRSLNISPAISRIFG